MICSPELKHGLSKTKANEERQKKIDKINSMNLQDSNQNNSKVFLNRLDRAYISLKNNRIANDVSNFIENMLENKTPEGYDYLKTLYIVDKHSRGHIV